MVEKTFHTRMQLPTGTDYLTVREIPRITALAMYPPIAPIDSRQVVTDILKVPNRKATHLERAVQFTEDEWATLMAIWGSLPTIRFPLSLSLDEWKNYVDVFEKSGHQPMWGIHPVICDEAFNRALLFNAAKKEHEKQLAKAINHGAVTTLSPLTKLAENHTVAKPGNDALVSVGQFGEFAATLGIELNSIPEFITCARPLHVDPALLTLAADVQIRFQNNIGGGSGTGWCSAGEYRAEIEERIERQAEGFFTLNEAAQVLTDSQPGVEIREMIGQMRSGFTKGELSIRNYGDRMPVLDEKNIRDFLSLVKVSDINSWLEHLGVNYRLPAAPADSKPEEVAKPDISLNDAASTAWKTKARSIAEDLLKNKKIKHLSVEQIAVKVHAEMKQQKIFGRGGRVPSADTIKRHALTGIKT